jgi:hypothetical protein
MAAFGLVAISIESFERAVVLARGVEDIRRAERATVPGIDMQAAVAYAQSVNELIQEWRNRFDQFPWGLAQFHARYLVDGAASAARNFELETRLRRPQTDRELADEVRSLGGGWPAVWITQIKVAREALEILSGERSFANSSFQTIRAGLEEEVEFLLISTPVIGEAVLVYEAASGRSAVGNRKLSDPERAMAGFGLIMPIIAAYALRTAVRAGAEAIKVTRRSVNIALVYARVYSILETAKRLPRCVEIAIGLRALPRETFLEFRGLLRLVAQGAALTDQQITRLSYFFIRMQDVSRLAQWLRIIEQELGTGFTGLRRLRGVRPDVREDKALALLAEKSGDPVVQLPETLPIDYPVRSPLKGEAVFPDAIWRGETCDLYAPTTGNAATVLRQVGGKQSQTSTVVVALLDDAGLTRSDVESRVLVDLWSNPRYAGVSKVVIVDSAGLVVHNRPDKFTLPMMLGLLRIGLGDPKRLARDVEELQIEPE